MKRHDSTCPHALIGYPPAYNIVCDPLAGAVRRGIINIRHITGWLQIDHSDKDADKAAGPAQTTIRTALPLHEHSCKRALVGVVVVTD